MIFVADMAILMSYFDNFDNDQIKSRNNGSEGTNNFSLLWADFHYCQYRE